MLEHGPAQEEGGVGRGVVLLMEAVDWRKPLHVLLARQLIGQEVAELHHRVVAL